MKKSAGNMFNMRWPDGLKRAHCEMPIIPTAMRDIYINGNNEDSRRSRHASALKGMGLGHIVSFPWQAGGGGGR
jgi:hypothetical protein